jgi:pimeloyl-ACP methyl ester carboxylesterase
MMFFLGHGYRVIAHDRRGHGRSAQVGEGHDMDHYADDLAALTTYFPATPSTSVIPPAVARWLATSAGTVRAASRRWC